MEVIKALIDLITISTCMLIRNKKVVIAAKVIFELLGYAVAAISIIAGSVAAITWFLGCFYAVLAPFMIGSVEAIPVWAWWALSVFHYLPFVLWCGYQINIIKKRVE